MKIARLLLLIALGASATAHAANLEFTVTDKDGQPVPDAVVLLRYLIKPATPPPVAATTVITQKNMKFEPFLSVVTPATTLRFTNADEFDHHIRANGPVAADGASTDFEARIGPQLGRTYDARLNTTGRYTLGCHLHSRMIGYVLVSDTPWFGRSDANGRITLAGLPDGPVDLQLWHPEQFLDQPLQRVQLSATTAEINTRLNFVPRKRKNAGV